MNTKPLKLLLIEDNAYDVKVIRLMLAPQREELLFDFCAAESLAEGLVQLAEHPADVALLDLNLPDSVGLETFRQVYKAFPHTPIIIISGTDDLTLAVQAVQLGAQDYLLKGEMSRNLLVRAIHHAVERHSILQKLNRRTQDLAESEARWRMITAKSADGIAIVDADGGVRFANPAAVRILNLAGIPAPNRVFPHPLPLDNTAEMTLPAGDDSAAVTVETDTVPIEWGETPAFLVILRDITVRKHVEIELQRAKDTLESVVKARTSELKKANQYLLDQISERRRTQRALNRALTEAEQARDHIDAILGSVADGLLVTDTHNRVVMMNQAAENILSIYLSEVIDQPIDFVFDNEVLRNRITLTLAENRHGYQFDFSVPSLLAQLTGKNKKPQIIRARTAIIRDKLHQPSGVLTIMYDVTYERELDRLKSEFISTAAHEFRTPLTTIQGFSEILLARDDLTAEARRKYLTYINNQALSLARIINEMLDISRLESSRSFQLSKVQCNIEETITGVVERFKQQGTRHTFRIVLDEMPADWVVDRPKIERVLENLLSNAVKYSPEGGLIQIRGESYQTLHSPVVYYHVAVQDQGIGMTLEQVDRIFDQFYRADASNTALEGIGLGMALVKHVVEAHGGRVWVESKVGAGTTAAFTIPLTGQRPQATP